MPKIFITQHHHDSISDFLGISRMTVDVNVIDVSKTSMIPWNKGVKGQIPWNKGKNGQPLPEHVRKINSERLKGRSYEEVYGEEKAKSMKASRSAKFKEIRSSFEVWNKGKKCPELAKPKPPISDETRKKMSDSAKKRPSHRKGIKMSEEQKEKIRQTLKERHQRLKL